MKKNQKKNRVFSFFVFLLFGCLQTAWAQEPDSACFSDVSESEYEPFEKAYPKEYHILEEAGFMVFSNTEVQYYGDTAAAFQSLLEDIGQANDFIYLEYYALLEGEAFENLYSLLKEKANEGVRVKVLYDAIGSIYSREKLPVLLTDAGIEWKEFHPIDPSDSSNLTTRNHRKMTIIDGQIVHSGSYNIGDQYFNLTHPYGQWKDCGTRVEGDAAAAYLDFFISMWNETEPLDLSIAPISAEEYSVNEEEKKSFFIPFYDHPKDSAEIGRDLFLSMVQSAEESLYLISPYLVIDDQMQSELQAAVERGVDVRLVVPGIPDKKLTNLFTKSYYPELIRAGVMLYEYTPGFIHSKLWVIDGKLAFVGSINLDYLSFYSNHENGLLIYRDDVIRDILNDYTGLLTECELMNP